MTDIRGVLIASLMLCGGVAGAFPKSQVLSKQNISFYPALRNGDRILVPFKQAPENDVQVVLLHKYKDLLPLKLAQKETITPENMGSPVPHFVFTVSEGKLDDSRTSFLVAVGKTVKASLKWNSNGTMNHGDFPLECMSSEKGFAVTSLEVFFNKELDAKLYHLRQGILQTTFDKMSPDERSSGVWYKETIGVGTKSGQCKVLGWNTSDGDGQNNKGTPEPLGKIYGVVQVSDGKTSERWLVLDAVGYEISGYTFIELLSTPSKGEAKQYFLMQDGL